MLGKRDGLIYINFINSKFVIRTMLSLHILCIIIEEQDSAHKNRFNINTITYDFKDVDVVKAHAQENYMFLIH